MRRIVLAGLFSFAFLTQAARADGLIYHLPANGSSVRYDTETTGSFNGQERTFKGSLTISSVGETTVDGEKCRWIELRMMTKRDDQERVAIAKCLIPEKHLGRGKSPGEHVIRGWLKQGDGEPQAFTDLKSAQGGGRLAGYLVGPPQNPGELEKIEIDGPLGKLACPAVTGTRDVEQANGTTSITFENRLHEKSPFGVVSAVWKFERKMNGQVTGMGTTKMTLADTSTTALSELPDRN
ncbi:MAG: hypothetical protein ACM3U2_10125 [Deltaproteobacteria bacterium]